MDFQQFLVDLGEALQAQGFNVYDHVPDRIDPPAFVLSPLVPGFLINYDTDGFGRGRLLIPIRFYHSRTDSKDGQKSFAVRLSTDGPESIKAAIEACRGGSWDSAPNVQNVTATGAYEFGSTSVIGGDWTTEFLV